jgi:hypothetical protein
MERGIKITRASIILSKNRSDINRCLLFIISPMAAENMQISMIMGVHVLVSMFQIALNE